MSLKNHIFQVTQIQVTMFCPLTSTSNILRKLGRVFQCGPCQSNRRGVIEVRSCGGGKLPGDTGRHWSYATGGAMVEIVTSGNYHKTPFLRESRCGYQVAG